VLKNLRMEILLNRLKVNGKRESKIHLLVAWDKKPVLYEDCTSFYKVKALYSY